MKLIKILLQTTIPTTADDWSIARFSLLARFLREQRRANGDPLFDVRARDRDPLGRPDSVLSTLDRSDFDQMWLFAVDVGNGLSAEDCAAISQFRRNGRGLMITRDHMDLGCSVCTLGGVGDAHHFHSINPDPDAGRREVDDPTRRPSHGRISIPVPTATTSGSRPPPAFIPCSPIRVRPPAPFASCPLIRMRGT